MGAALLGPYLPVISGHDALIATLYWLMVLCLLVAPTRIVWTSLRFASGTRQTAQIFVGSVLLSIVVLLTLIFVSTFPEV